ncbi:tyrosine-protein phosphatase non-receptor type 5-like [Pollicipes pollicipes]|uniref:tyrosine-protein phosphatase non-receptor type 5-like n=1 Tax=Pollicipes pollicipes TaxID=41117 RepID=UPI0018852A3B|nr:tyrosine-protein phosphatase non-receptor type 5-like [Pollicipes pollicipes]XP_037070866.1 tyrosine-protein phosphatase non-receptor type 5-like [Pollicipes pollicipes]
MCHWRRSRRDPGRIRQWIPHRVLRMSTEEADAPPPDPEHAATVPPTLAKAKGLLERRGSNNSLTIQVQQSTEDTETIRSAGMECPEVQFLTSAGNRLSRRQLRETEWNSSALRAEFWDIPLNFPDRCPMPGTGANNRYNTVIPNEHSRVLLPARPEDPLSTYINANWIKGYDGEERAYIATQGPLAHTLGDFWRMVLHHRAPAVVMITKLREDERIKCAGYLPETRQTSCFGGVQVTVQCARPRSGYTVRQVLLQCGEERLELRHFWFTAWPDHQAPDHSRQLLQMAAEVETARRSQQRRPPGPVVVHCSAGIGRTGCFIATSIGACQLQQENSVDVLGIVCGLRQDRGGMVQTAEQYIFLHKALRDFEATLPPIGSADKRMMSSMR